MSERVGIVAVAQTKYEEDKVGLDIPELVYEVVEKVVTETELTFGDGGIEATVSCSQDHWDGRTISSISIQDVVGAHLGSEEKVAADGAYAVAYGFMQILSGHHDIVLVVAHTKESQVSDARLIENQGVDPLFQRRLGLDFLSGAAIQARRYMDKYGVTPSQCAQVVIKNRMNAKNNPFAQSPLDLTIEDVLNSKMLASPIRSLDAKPISDGACALILASESKAKKLASKPVWIRGIGSCYDAHFLGDRDLADCDSLFKAAKLANKMADIQDPFMEIDMAEISEYYSYQELLWMEGLGFCDRGEAGKLIEKGTTAMGGKLPVNPSGGLLSGVPTNVAGLSRVAEVTLQLQGKAGNRQLSGIKTALAHGTSGLCGQMHCVIILGN